MQKAPIVALLILVVLTGAYLLLRQTPETTITSPMTVAALQNMDRLEIVHPEGSKPAMTAFEKRGDGWWITRPVEAKVSKRAQEKFDELFAKPIATDDLTLDPKKLSEYQLDDPGAVRVSAYEKGSEKPALELEIGREIEVAQTGVHRTYIKKPNAAKVYRAQAGLGDFVRKPTSELRSKKMTHLDEADISALSTETTQAPQDAAGKSPAVAPQVPLKLSYKDATWTLVEPPLAAIAQDGETLDEDKVSGLAQRLANLRADGFAEDKTPAEIGLDPAQTTVTVTTGADTHTLRLGASTEDKKVYARFDDGPIFTLSQFTADRLHPAARTLLKSPKKPAPKPPGVAGAPAAPSGLVGKK